MMSSLARLPASLDRSSGYGRSKGKDRAVRAAAVRILYRSTNPSGEPIAVSGAILFPPGPAPAGGRDVIMS